MRFKSLNRVLLIFGWGLAASLCAMAGNPPQSQSPAKVRTYYVAADEVDWDYAPSGINKMMGMKFERIQRTPIHLPTSKSFSVIKSE